MYEIVYGVKIVYARGFYMATQNIVLVRAFANEPHQLKAQISNDREVVVFKEVPENGIPYPRAYIYEWDSDLFADLLQAYQAGEPDTLTSLWSRAKLFSQKTTH
jgi:hypothetical protein